MNNEKKLSWQPGKRDVVFLAIIAVVVLLLVLGTGDRTTRAVPGDEVHRTAVKSTQCMACHQAESQRPQPLGHTKSDQCFQCHVQPKDWMGALK
ncbi:MAG: cytochrome c3 family protein [Mariprofundus sp.]